MTFAGNVLALTIRAVVLTGLCTAPVMAQDPSGSPAPAPSPTATPAAVSDPCDSLISIVNRPTSDTGVCTVRPGKVDIESGYTNTTVTGAGGGNTIAYPQSLIRIGTSDPHLDVEVGQITEYHSTVGGIRQDGIDDLGIGAKYELGYTSVFDYGTNVLVTIPNGSKAFSAGNMQFTGNFNWGYTVNSVLSLSGTLGFNALSAYNQAGVAQSYFAFTPALDLTAALAGPSQIIVEYGYASAAGPNLGSRSLFDFAYQHDLGNHVQLDINYGISPTSINGQKYHYVGAGISLMN